MCWNHREYIAPTCPQTVGNEPLSREGRVSSRPLVTRKAPVDSISLRLNNDSVFGTGEAAGGSPNGAVSQAHAASGEGLGHEANARTVMDAGYADRPTCERTSTEAPTGLPTSVKNERWQDINWGHVSQHVFSIQRRIYDAAKKGNQHAVHKLQKRLLGSHHARLLAVRKVTQDNQGKRTAGVDGVKSLSPEQRLKLACELSLDAKADDYRPVEIPKANGKIRTLMIPTMRDRATQALAKLALEPEWEAKSDPCSFGFRPGRSAHDAIEQCFTACKKVPKWVWEIDIEACFDAIDHEALIHKMKTFGKMERLIRGWLKALAKSRSEFYPKDKGVPQGSPIGPLLANVALNGLETYLKSKYPKGKWTEGRTKYINWKPQISRYADDIRLMHRDKAVAEEMFDLATDWLAQMG